MLIHILNASYKCSKKRGGIEPAPLKFFSWDKFFPCHWLGINFLILINQLIHIFHIDFHCFHTFLFSYRSYQRFYYFIRNHGLILILYSIFIIILLLYFIIYS